MEHPSFHISLDDFPGLFVVPAVTDGAIWGEQDQVLYKRFKRELLHQLQAHGQGYNRRAQWHALNELRHRYVGVDDQKSMACANLILAQWFMDPYILQILGGWKLDTEPQEGVKTLLAHAERYSSLFYLRAACLIRAAEICLQYHLTTAARRLYLAVLASTCLETCMPEPYMKAAQEGYFQIQDEANLASPNCLGWNPISRAQEGFLRMTLKKHKIAAEADHIAAMAQSGIGFRDAPGREDQIGGTRFGGLPDVPPDWTWPGHLLEFIAQFNLEEIAPHDHNRVLPSHGLLSVFVRNLCYGWEHSSSDYHIMFYDGDMGRLQRAEAPDGYDVMGDGACLSAYGAVSASPYKIISLFTGDENCEYEDNFTTAVAELREVRTPLYNFGWDHQLLGHSSEDYYMQGEAQPAGTEWVFLLQVDSNDHIGMNFSDAGMLFFYIHQDDLAAHRFDRLHLTMTCG